jgi:PAS domain S-box-containing protein
MSRHGNERALDHADTKAPFEGVTFRPSMSGGDVGQLVRSMDWSATPLGPRSGWPRSLHCVVETVLDLPTPAIVFWGSNQTQIYNEGYAMIMGPRHPRYLGASFEECWPEAYPVIHPWMERVLEHGEVVEVDRSLIPLTRHGFVEECYFSFTFSPLRNDEGRIAGVLQIVTELTARILYERRNRTLSDLAAAKVALGGVMDDLARALSTNPLDIAGFAVHLWNASTARLERTCQSCDAADDAGIPHSSLLHALQSNTATMLAPPDALFECLRSPAWPEPIRSACILPIRRTRADPPLGVATLGISPRLRFDDQYKDFFEGVAREIAMSLSTAQAEQMAREVSIRTRQVEEAHRELERKKSELHAIVTSLPEAVILTDVSRRFVMVNPAFTRMYGFAEAEVVGKTVEMLHADTRDFETRWAARYSEASTAPAPDESMHRRRDGSVFWCETITSVVRDALGAPLGYLERLLDISARKQRDERRALLAEATGALISSLDCYATLDAVAHLLVPKVADWCAILLLSESGFVERELMAHADPDREHFARQLRAQYPFDCDAPDGAAKVMRTRTPEIVRAIGLELPSRNARDEEHLRALRHLGGDSFMCVPLEARGRILGAVTLASAESNHAYTEDDLAMAVELATRMSFAIDNARLYEDAKRAIELRDEFLSIASHELKTPLAPLKLQLQTVVKLVQERRLAAYPPEHLQRLFDRAVHHVDRLAYLVEDLLDVSKLTSGRFDLQLEEADLVTLVRDAADLLASEAQEKGCVVRLAMPTEARGRWAPRRIEQVVVNLLTNAMKFGPGKPIEVSVERRGAGFALRVRDHGIGIAAEDQARIFQRFERAVSSTAYGGFGLGLYITRKIITLHGGRIDVSSEPGQGAAFTVWLPAGDVANEGG